MKEVKKTSKSKNFYLIVVDEIVKSASIKDILLKHNISKQKLNYYVNKLKSKGLIKKIGYGVWALCKQYREVKQQVKKFSLGSKVEKPCTNLHALQINFPILKGKIYDKDWQVSEKLKNWIPKYKKLDILDGLTLKNNNHKSLTVFAHSRDIEKLEELDNLAIKIRAYVCEYFKNQGVVLDYFNAETKNMNLATEDKVCKGMNRKGEKFELDLCKKSEKIFPNDKIDAKAWIDGSPFDFSAETNDKEWKRWYLGMPFMVRNMFYLMDSMTNSLVNVNEKIDYVAAEYASHVGMVQEGYKMFKKMNRKLDQTKLNRWF